MKTLFHTDDQIISNLELPDPCPISIEIKEKDIILHVGQRDWQWDLENGHLVGQGTCVESLIKDWDGLTKSQRHILKTHQENVRQSLLCDNEKRKKKKLETCV